MTSAPAFGRISSSSCTCQEQDTVTLCMRNSDDCCPLLFFTSVVFLIRGKRMGEACGILPIHLQHAALAAHVGCSSSVWSHATAQWKPSGTGKTGSLRPVPHTVKGRVHWLRLMRDMAPMSKARIKSQAMQNQCSRRPVTLETNAIASGSHGR